MEAKEFEAYLYNILCDALDCLMLFDDYSEDIEAVSTFQENGPLTKNHGTGDITKNHGIVVTMTDGSSFQLSILKEPQ